MCIVRILLCLQIGYMALFFHSFIQAKCIQGKGNLQFILLRINRKMSAFSSCPSSHPVQDKLVRLPYNTQKKKIYTKHPKVSLNRLFQSCKLFITKLDKLPCSFYWNIASLTNQCLKLHCPQSFLGSKSLNGFKVVLSGLSRNHVNDIYVVTMVTCDIILARLGLLRRRMDKSVLFRLKKKHTENKTTKI